MELKTKIGFSILIVMIGIQFIPVNYNQSTNVLSTSFLENHIASEEIDLVIRTSCYNCHSNNTIYPWYGKIQPIAYFLEKHISNGKEELNFSIFKSYSNRKQKNLIKSMISQIEDNEMPIPSYIYIHS